MATRNTPPLSECKMEQVQALLSGNAYHYATQQLKVSDMSEHAYVKVFTVTRQEIDQYVDEHGVPKNAYNRAETGIKEGINVGESDGIWHLFWVERGREFSSASFRSPDKLKKALVDMLLQMSGTGLDFK